MDWGNLLDTIIKVVIIPVIPLLALWLKCWISKQIEKLEKELEKRELEVFNEYLNIVRETAFNIVHSVKQTYVDELKRENSWTLEKQKEAFDIAKEKVLKQITEGGKKLLEKGLGDYEAFIEDLIEAYIDELPSDNQEIGEPEEPTES